ncbi:MAG TPA: GAF domain-containing protein, partial [Chloroflexota bacterium]
LRDLALRIDAQTRQIAAQRRRLADQVASRSGGEAARRASETRFRAVFDGAGVGVAVTSLTGEVQESNAVLQQMLGRDAEHLRGRLLPDLVAPADAPTLRAAFDALVRDGGSRQRADARVVRADGATLATALTATAVHDGAAAARFAIVVVEDTTERVRQQSRRAALLRVARRLAASPDRDAVLADLLGEAELLLGADAANVFRWDEARGELILVMSSLEEAARTGPIRPGEGAVGRAVAERAAVVVADYQSDPAAIPTVREAGVRAVAAVPLMEEGRVLGALSVAQTKPGRGFDADDVEVLELLAEAAAAALVGLERARLDGVMLAARTAEHELNNRLAPTVGYAELLASDPALPPDLRALAMLTMRGARDAARIVQQLRLVTRLEETDWGPNVNTTIDIERSIEEDKSG